MINTRMLFNEITFIGIDPSAGRKPFVYTALDYDLHLLALGEGTLDDILAFCAGQHLAAVAICAPRQPNQGLMLKPDVRAQLAPPPQPGRWENFRLADYLLRRRGISIPQTPSSEDACPRWMRMGFRLYRRLAELGYVIYPSSEALCQMMEVYPYASYAALTQVLPLPKHSLEGRLQRQLSLYEKGLVIPDPMLIFEEITRRRLLKGILPLDKLYNAYELDALVAAYTARLAVVNPEQVILLGNQEEGQIILPAPE